ncbi:type VI secretion system Vgr family protein, partial [Paraherbaspirillum soli]
MPTASRTLSAKSPAIPEHLPGRPALLAVRLSGSEGINSLFEYRLLLKTPDAVKNRFSLAARFNLDDFIGRDLTVSIALDGDGTREISGLISDAKMLREAGRDVSYELTLRPWLHLATLRTNSKIFQEQTVVEVLEDLLVDYAFPVEKRLYDFTRYPKRDYQTQYNETDFAFFSRLCEEWGISYFFEHSDGAHRLILADANAAF